MLTPAASGNGRTVSRCPTCRVAVWNDYAGAGDRLHPVRVGTLDEPDRWPPDVHIFAASKPPWAVLPAGTPAFAEYDDSARLWPANALARRRQLFDGTPSNR